MTMKRKVLIGIIIAIVLAISGVFLYIGIGKININTKMHDYLKQENYAETDIKAIEIKHSFSAKILSYNEWNIEVTFEDEPESVYTYTVKKGDIVQTGAYSSANKDDLKHIE